jgi:hypothetical protein
MSTGPGGGGGVVAPRMASSTSVSRNIHRITTFGGLSPTLYVKCHLNPQKSTEERNKTKMVMMRKAASSSSSSQSNRLFTLTIHRNRKLPFPSTGPYAKKEKLKPEFWAGKNKILAKSNEAKFIYTILIYSLSMKEFHWKLNTAQKKKTLNDVAWRCGELQSMAEMVDCCNIVVAWILDKRRVWLTGIILFFFLFFFFSFFFFFLN